MKKKYYVITASYKGLTFVFNYTHEFTIFNVEEFQNIVLSKAVSLLSDYVFVVNPINIELFISLVHSE